MCGCDWFESVRLPVPVYGWLRSDSAKGEELQWACVTVRREKLSASAAGRRGRFVLSPRL